MYLHANAKLGLAGRFALVRAIESGLSLKAAAAAFSVSPATAHRWWRRWLDGGLQAAALVDRSSRPHHSPGLLAAELQERICDCRRKTGWGPRLVAGATGFAHSTVWKVLKRADDGQRLQLRQDPLAARAAQPARHPASQARAVPAAHERQGGALPPDDGTRVGVRSRLPLTSTPQRRAATLARQLQPATAAQ